MTRFRPGISMQTGIVPEGRESVPGEEVAVHMRRVSPGYCRTLGVPLEAGRELDERDQADAPHAAMLSRSLARRLWPGQDPIGKRIQRRTNPPVWLGVVGVVGDVRDTGPASSPCPPSISRTRRTTWPASRGPRSRSWCAVRRIPPRSRPGAGGDRRRRS
jgi:hypothetical protein